MGEPAKKEATYEDLYSVPESMTGKIIDGELVVTPRPSRRHTSAASSLGFKIGPGPFPEYQHRQEIQNGNSDALDRCRSDPACLHEHSA
jgi:hypothetical protein